MNMNRNDIGGDGHLLLKTCMKKTKNKQKKGIEKK